MAWRAITLVHRVEADAAGVPTVTRFMLQPGEAEVTQMGTDGKTYDSETITCARADETP